MTHLAAEFDQIAWRFRNDDGSETTATWMEAQNVSPGDVAPTQQFRLRMEVQETAGGGANNQTIVLQYNVNGAGWNDIGTSSSFVRLASSSHVANGTATTDQLTAGTGTFLAGIVCTTTSGTNISFAGNEHTEVEWSVEMVLADIVENDEIQFRVIVQDTVPTATAGNPLIVAFDPIRVVSPDSLLVTQAVSEPFLSQIHKLSIDDITAATGISEPTILAITTLTPDSVSVNTDISDPVITQIHHLGVNDLAVSTLVSEPGITQIHKLSVDSLHTATELSSPETTVISFIDPDKLTTELHLSSPSFQRIARTLRLLTDGSAEAAEIVETTGALLTLDPTGTFLSTGGEFVEINASKFTLDNTNQHVIANEFLEV